MDKQVLRKLAGELADIANMPIQETKRRLWIENNGLRQSRPLVTMDQLPWHELNVSEELQLECKDEFLRSVENDIRRVLYRWKHFPLDMVVENRVDIPIAIKGIKYGTNIVEDIIDAGDGNEIVSHKYHDELKDDSDIERLTYDKITVDTKLNQQRFEICNDIFGDIISPRIKGVEIHVGIWDRIAMMKPADSILWDMIDRPDFIKKVVKRFMDITMNTIDQCENLGALDGDMQYVHCTGAYTDELPRHRADQKPVSKDCWAFGMSQIFSTVSPQMHNEFDIEIMKPLYERFGLIYYGCCEPLHNVIPYIKNIKNVRKISVSPWANVDESAELIGSDYVFSAKPNPSYIASGKMDKDAVKKQVRHVIDACNKNNTNCEIILKDVSTIKGNISVLDEWAMLVMSLVE